jgi:hypothetical protein
MIVAGAAMDCAHAQVRLEARFVISMSGIPIGKTAWTIEIGDTHYAVTANGGASGLMSVLGNGQGLVKSQGIVRNGRLTPQSFTAHGTEEDQKTELRMRLDAGNVTELIIDAAPSSADRIPLTEAHQHGIIDPLTALLITEGGTKNALEPENCSRTLPIFDGRRRYDIGLWFKRMDHVKAETGYEGPALVCGMVLKPIAGHRATSTITKYVAGKRDIEIWFAPITSTFILAPFRVAIPTLVGTMMLQANHFELTR